jgi:hypothetical protein
MIYINEKLLETRNRSKGYEFADVVADYHKELKKIREYYGDYLTINTNVRPYRDKKTGVHRFPGPRGLLLVSTVNREVKDEYSDDPNAMISVTEEIRYSPQILKKNDDGSLKHDDPNLLISRGSYSIDIRKNPDLAYFVQKSGKVGKTPAEGKKFYIHDIKYFNKENAKRRKLEGQVINLIYSALPEGKLRTLAKSFGVADVNLKDVESVREDLYHRLQAGEEEQKRVPESKARGFKEFIESSEVRLHDQIAELCTDAQEKDVLVYNINERRWEIDYKDGGSPYVLKEMSGNEYGDPLGSLVNYLITESGRLRKLEAAMGIGKETETPRDPGVQEVPKYTLEQVMTTTNVPTLKKMLKELGYDGTIRQNAKGQWLKEEIIKRLPQEAER